MDNKDEKINFLVEENRKYKVMAESNQFNNNLLAKLKILQLENIKLQEQNKDPLFYLNKIKLLQEQVENLQSKKEEAELLKNEVIKLKIEIKNMQPGGKADPRQVPRQTIISSEARSAEAESSRRYKKKVDEMKFFLKKRKIYGEYNAWKKRL